MSRNQFTHFWHKCRENNLRTLSGKFLRVKFCRPESWDFLGLCWPPLKMSTFADETGHAWHEVQEGLHVQLCSQVHEHHHSPRHRRIQVTRITNVPRINCHVYYQGVHERSVGDSDEEMQFPLGRKWEGWQLHHTSPGQVAMSSFLNIFNILL